MKCLVVVLLTIAVAQAAVVSTQYHAQDGHHGYSYGYNSEHNKKEESASNGHVKGEYKVSDKHGLFHTEVTYEFPQEHHNHHEHEHHGSEHHHHHEEPKPFSYYTVVHHPEEQHHHHEHHQEHHQQNHFNHHHLHKRSLWHHNKDHQQHLSHNEVFHHEPSHHGHEEHHRWTGPIHVPVLHHGVPTETPEVQKARAHHQHKLEEAHHHAGHSHHGHGWEDEHQYQHEEHHHHEQPKWTGPIHVPVLHHGVPTETPEVRHAKAHFASKHAELKQHAGHGVWNQEEEHSQDHHHGGHRWTGPVHVPVIEHGVPTETPEVRHAKVHFLTKFSEAKAHSGYSDHHDDHSSQHWSNGHDDHHQHHNRWTGPIHVPVIEHGVPTETPEVRHAKVHHAAKHAQSGYSHDHGHHYAQHYNNHHEARWTGPTHNPVIVHGVPTETPEVRHAKAHFASKHAALQQHAGHGVWDQEEYAHNYHHGEHRWTGPVHVPVIKHGVPTETPEVRHAKAHLQQKFAEAQSHPDFDKDCDNEKSHGQSHHGWHQANKHY